LEQPKKKAKAPPSKPSKKTEEAPPKPIQNPEQCELSGADLGLIIEEPVILPDYATFETDVPEKII